MIAAAGFGGAAASAGAPPFAAGRFGACGVERGIDGAYATLRQAGFEWVRVFLPWPDIQPTPDPPDFDSVSIGAKCGSFDWPRSSARQIIEAARAHGLSIMAVLFKTPCWATSANTACEGLPPRVEAWQAFVTAMVTEFGDDVAVWELWNEPNYTSHWAGSPQLYRDRILVPGYDAIKAVRPDAKVAGPTLYNRKGGPNTPQQTDDPGPYLLDGGQLARPIDVLTFHAYGQSAGVFRKNIKRANRFATKYAIPETWLTEFGWSKPASRGKCPSCGGCARCKSEANCASRIGSVFEVVDASLVPRFTKAFNFSLHDRNRANCGKGCGYGLYDANGQPRERLTSLLQ